MCCSFIREGENFLQVLLTHLRGPLTGDSGQSLITCLCGRPRKGRSLTNMVKAPPQPPSSAKGRRCRGQGAGTETGQGPEGSWAHKPFCVPRFLFLGSRLQPPRPPLSSKGRFKVLIREGRGGRDQGGAFQGQQRRLGAGPDSASGNIPDSIFL